MNGHDLAREIIRKHGRDRYPTADLNLLKLVEEVGELAAAALEFGDDPSDESYDHLRKEYGDAGIALHALGDKLGLNLLDEMHDVVMKETRRFG